jgi:hypothetical protein
MPASIPWRRCSNTHDSLAAAQPGAFQQEKKMAIEYFGGTKTVEDPTAKFRAALAERERRGLSTAGMCWSEKRGWHPRPREDRASRNTPRPESAHTSAMLA